MHFPRYHHKKSWQRFFLGLITGIIISYVIILYMYGAMYEQLVEKNLKLHGEVTELEDLYESLLQDREDEDEARRMQSIVETIEITITNHKELKLDRLLIHQFSELIKAELKHIIGMDLSVLAASDQLLISTIEKKAFTIDDFTYYFDVEKLIISQTVKLQLSAHISQ